MSLAMSSFVRRLAFIASTIGGVYLADDKWNARTLQRNVLTAWNGICIGLDYKINFRPGKGDKIDDLHERVAKRILNVCLTNGGLYIKLGQAIGVQSTILPAAYQKTFKQLYDDAPAVDFDRVVKVFKEDFNCHPDEIFDDFERTAIASASIAQVHRAKLKDGTPVAVKVQKPDIRRQIDWDLLAYKGLMHMYEYIFDLPLVWSADYTEKHLRQEVDFENEGRNSERVRIEFEKEGSLSDKVYVPKVFWDQTSKRVLTAEWINGIKITDREGLQRLGFSFNDVMKTVIDIFADPHPGNVMVRPHPSKSNKYYQVVLIDHGLCMEESIAFRHQYCLFWKSLFLMDSDMINQICKEWGINEPELFVSATLMKPYTSQTALHISSTQAATLRDAYEMQMAVKDRIRKFLADTELIPRELIFVGRNMNIVRALNRELGSPVNRVNLMGNWAVKGLGPDWSNWGGNAKTFEWQQRQISQFISDGVHRLSISQKTFLSFFERFYFNNAKEAINSWIYNSGPRGFEEVLDDQIKTSLEENFGMMFNEKIFEG
ncbi:7906_t:CDS:10, partial [Cetraspora pellucida]